MIFNILFTSAKTFKRVRHFTENSAYYLFQCQMLLNDEILYEPPEAVSHGLRWDTHLTTSLFQVCTDRN